MDRQVTEFSERLELQMAEVERQTDTLAGSLQTALDDAAQRNNDILRRSQATLSEMQFQDPMARELQRAEHDVGKLRQLVLASECDDVSLAVLKDDVGDDGSDQRPTGDVDLF